MGDNLEKSLKNVYHSTKIISNYRYEKKQSKNFLIAGAACAAYLSLRFIFGQVNFDEEPTNLLQSFDTLISVAGFGSIFYGGFKYLKSSLGINYYKNEIEKERANVVKLTGTVPVFPEEQPNDFTLN